MTAPAPVTVMVVDDHPMWRDAVARDLTDSGFNVVATAATGAEAIARARATRPNVVVLDLNIPPPSGVEVTASLMADDDQPRVLVLSASGEQADVLEAVKAGATGYLIKSASREELTDAVRRVAVGDTVFTPGLAGLVLGEYRRLSEGPSGNTDPDLPRLTERETEVLRLVAKGMSYKQIAERLVLSHRTVQNHVQNTLRKLQLHNRVQLVRYAIEQGLDEDAVTLHDVAYELYGLPPGEFVKVRDARAKSLRATEKDLADEVKALRKPSTAAWAVNLLARSKADLLDQVLTLGVSLRQAQAGLQGDELRALARQRRQLVAAVVGEVRALALAAGVRLTEPVSRQVEDTLSAAMVDEAAAAAVHSGMLTEALASTGMGSLALGSVVGVIPGRLHVVPPPAGAADERARAMRVLEQASALLADAEARLDKAAKKKSKREARTLQLQAALDEVRRRAAELEHEIDVVADELEEAEQAHAAALELRDEAKLAAADAAKIVAGTT